MEGRGSILAQRCLDEIRERSLGDGELSDWEKERKQFFESRGIDMRKWERNRTEGGMGTVNWEERENRTQREERWERIESGRFSKFYKWVKEEGIPEYLRKEWRESRDGEMEKSG